MSNDVLKLIPIDPLFVPAAEAQEHARQLLASFISEASEVKANVFPQIVFVDAGQNFGTVLCPSCGTHISRGWWQGAMDNAYRTNLTDLTVSLPCCRITVSLNDLRYEWAVGFARFVLEVCNPKSDLNTEQFCQLEQAIGNPLRKILARY